MHIRNCIFNKSTFKKELLINTVSYSILTFISFLSWNYFGLLFFVNGVFLFFLVDKYLEENFLKYISHCILFILSWKTGALFWMFFIDKGVFGFVAIVSLSLIPFILLFFLNKISKKFILSIFIFLWVLYEAFHNFSTISFPWLTLGNVFSTNIYLIQWYKYTGVLGGSIWFLFMSYFLYKSLKKNNYTYLKYTGIIFSLVSFFSFYCLIEGKSKKDDLSGKTFVTFNNEKVVDSLKGKDLAFYIYKLTKKIDHKKKILLIPETTFRGLNTEKYENTLIFNYLKKIITDNGFEQIYFGTTMYKPQKYITNSSVFMSENKSYTKTKEKLIISNEYVPKKFSAISNKKSFNPFAHDTSEQIIREFKVLPMICYEAFYSYYALGKNKNTKIIYLLSSEKFFNNSFWGRNQYDNILKLRSVENEIPLVKSSNCGNSLVINSKGSIIYSSRNELNIYNHKN